MKSRIAALATICLLATWILNAGLLAQDAAPPAATEEQGEMIRHVVMFKFKPEATEADINSVEQAFAALADKIDVIADLEWGTNNSPEKHDKGFTHCFLLTFNSAADRDAYLPHPEHKKFGNVLRPHLEDVFVLDYTPAK